MLDDLHIIDFCNDVSKALLMLHQQFPRPIELYVADMIGYEQPDEYGLHSKRHESCLSTLLWLREEGWIRFQSIVKRESIDQTVMTQRCFNRLHRAACDNLLQAHWPDSDELLPGCLPRMVHCLYAARKEQDSAAIRATVMTLLVSDKPTTYLPTHH